MSKIVGLEKLIRNETSITIKVAFSDYWVDGYAHLRTKMWCGSNVAYSETGWGRDNAILDGDVKTVTLGSLSPGTFYEISVVYQTKSNTSGSDWVNNTDVVTYRILTNGRTPKWSWSATNYDYFETVPYTGFQVRYSDDDALVYTNATADLVKKAYSTLTGNQLPTSGVDTRIWNSIVRRISAIQTEWGVPEGRHLDEIRPTVFCTTRDPGYYYDYDHDKYIWLDGKSIKAYKFNKAVECIPVKIDWPWVKELGRKEIKPGDICKASYFLALVNALNHWIGLEPKYLSFTDNYIHDFSVGSILLPSFPCTVSDHIPTREFILPGSASSIAAEFDNRSHLTEVFDLFVESGGLYFTSLYNFFEYQSQCAALAAQAGPLPGVAGKIAGVKEKADIDSTDSDLFSYAGSIINPVTSVDIAALDRHRLEHTGVLHTTTSEVIDLSPAIYLEQHGFFGFINKFTISRREELDDYAIDGTIYVRATIDYMAESVGNAMVSAHGVPVSGVFSLLTQNSAGMAHAGNCYFADSLLIGTTILAPLDFSGRVDISSDVDNIRLSQTYELPVGSAPNIISTQGVAAIPQTLNVGGAGASIGVTPVGDNAKSSSIEIEGAEDLTLNPSDAMLTGQKNTAVSAAVSSLVKLNSEAVIRRQTYAEGESISVVESESIAVIRTPKPAEGVAVIHYPDPMGQVVAKQPRNIDAMAEVRSDTLSELYGLNMVKARLTESKYRAIFSAAGELTATKGQKDISLDCPSTVDTNAVVEFTVPTPVGAVDSESIVCAGSLEMRQSHKIESGTAAVEVSSAATVSISGISLVLASDIDDISAVDIDDTLVFEVERKLTSDSKED